MGFFSRHKEKENDKPDDKPDAIADAKPDGKSDAIADDKSDAKPDGNPLIEAYDAFGRMVVMDRTDWLQSVFPGQLAKNWDEPNALYQNIVQAVQDGFDEEIRPAAEHLKEIDPTNERGYAILSDIYMKISDLDKAENILHEYIAEYGKTGTVLTHLANVYAVQGKKDVTLSTLWEGLQIDPNQKDGISRWVSITCEEKGEEYYPALLEKACLIENSWLPQLYLAKHLLEKKRIDEAKALYKQIMPYAANNPPILFMMAGDLGHNEYLQECIDIVGPSYDCQKQDIRTGINLLQAYLAVGDCINGPRLLGEIMQLNRPDLRLHLMKVGNDFEKIKTTHTDYLVETSKTLKFTMLTQDRPVWHYEMQSPDWLLPERKRRTKVGILSYSDISPSNIDSRIVQREDDTGRLTRSIPLILLETLLFFTDHEPIAVMPVAIGIGSTVSSKEEDEDYLKDIAEKRNMDYVITGSVLVNDSGYGIRNQIYSRAQKKTSIVRMNTTGEEFGQNCIEMISDIHAKLGSPITRAAEQRETQGETKSETLNETIYQIPKPALFPEYLSALAKLFTQTLNAYNAASKESLWEEKSMLSGYLDLALADPENQIFHVMLVSGMAKSKLCQSEVYKEFKEQTISLLSGNNLSNESNESNESNYSRRLLPFVYNMFDMRYEFYTQKKILLSTIKDKRYCKWLKQISPDK